MIRRSLSVLRLCIATIPLMGCGSAATRLPALPDPHADQARCVVRPSQMKPLVVDWPAPERGSLEARLGQGLTVVRFDGCEMEVLRHCQVPGRYGYTGFTKKTDVVRMQEADELWANVPVSAAKLEARLHRGYAITARMTLVGMYEARRTEIGRDELSGACEGATHLITGAQVGAYEFFAEQQAGMNGEVGAVGVGVGGESSAKRETLSRDGMGTECATATIGDQRPPANCGALLRLELASLLEHRTTSEDCDPGTAGSRSDCLRTSETSGGCERGDRIGCESACERGDRWGCYNLGSMFRNGNGVDKDIVKAVGLYNRACELDLPEGCATAAYAYRIGIGVDRDEPRAVDLYAKACQRGFPDGCAGLGEMYEAGTGVAQDVQRSAALFRDACDAGSGPGCFQLGYAFETGEGVVKDVGAAAEAFRKACSTESVDRPDACAALGRLYYLGQGVEKDLVKALKHLATGCEANNNSACFYLKMLCDEPTDIPGKEAKCAAARP